MSCRDECDLGKGKMTETALPAFGLDLLVEKAMFKYPDLSKAVNNIHVDLAISNPGGRKIPNTKNFGGHKTWVHCGLRL